MPWQPALTQASVPSAPARPARWAQISLYALLTLVIIGLNPLGEKVKTIPATGEGDIYRQISYLLIFVFTIAGSLRSRSLRELIPLPITLLVALGYCWLSIVWAIEPDVATRRLILTTVIIWVIFRSVQEAGYETTMHIIRVILMITLVLNYIALVVTPAAIHQEVDVMDLALIGNWRGVLPQKNFAGAICAMTMLLFLLDSRQYPAILRIGVVVLSAFFLFKSKSKTSMALFVPALFIGVACLAYSVQYRRAVAAGVGMMIGVLSLLLYINWETWTAPVLSEDALTGRGQIWPILLNYASDHLLFGSGYGSFWNIGPESPIFVYTKSWVATLANGHNGYLDALVHLGVPGLVLIVIACVLAPLFRLLGNERIPKARLGLLLALLFFCAAHNMTESSLFDRDMIVQVFLMLTIALVGPAEVRRQGPAPAPSARAGRLYPFPRRPIR